MVETLIKERLEVNIEEMYQKVVTQPNDSYQKRGYIKCPQCGDCILMIPTLKVMNQAIECHVKIHKENLKGQPFQCQKTAIKIRLDLAQQVLQNTNTRDI